jgi:hypothetical protein
VRYGLRRSGELAAASMTGAFYDRWIFDWRIQDELIFQIPPGRIIRCPVNNLERKFSTTYEVCTDGLIVAGAYLN